MGSKSKVPTTIGIGKRLQLRGQTSARIPTSSSEETSSFIIGSGPSISSDPPIIRTSPPHGHSSSMLFIPVPCACITRPSWIRPEDSSKLDTRRGLRSQRRRVHPLDGGQCQTVPGSLRSPTAVWRPLDGGAIPNLRTDRQSFRQSLASLRRGQWRTLPGSLRSPTAVWQPLVVSDVTALKAAPPAFETRGCGRENQRCSLRGVAASPTESWGWGRD